MVARSCARSWGRRFALEIRIQNVEARRMFQPFPVVYERSWPRGPAQNSQHYLHTILTVHTVYYVVSSFRRGDPGPSHSLIMPCSSRLESSAMQIVRVASPHSVRAHGVRQGAGPLLSYKHESTDTNSILFTHALHYQVSVHWCEMSTPSTLSSSRALVARNPTVWNLRRPFRTRSASPTWKRAKGECALCEDKRSTRTSGTNHHFLSKPLPLYPVLASSCLSGLACCWGLWPGACAFHLTCFFSLRLNINPGLKEHHAPPLAI